MDRFCGPATTVELVTGGVPSKVVRSLGQAVAETGLQLSSLVLTPQQLDILDKPLGLSLFLQGPPGTGKSVMLLLRGSSLAMGRFT